MKLRPIHAAVVTAIFGCLLCTAFAQTLTVKDSENPEALVNTGTETALKLKIIVPEEPLTVRKNCNVRVELHNTGSRIEIVYMPALTMRPSFRADQGTRGVSDEFGPPMVFGRTSAKDEALNYVVLMGGDYYGRRYDWAPLATGAVTFQATYENKQTGPNQKLPAWRGTLREGSASLKVSPK